MPIRGVAVDDELAWGVLLAVAVHGAGAVERAAEDSAGSPEEVAGAFSVLPASSLWSDVLADSRSPRSSLTFRVMGDAGIDATLALPVPIVGFEAGPWRAQAGLTAALFLGFQPSGPVTFDFQTFDGWFALPIDVSSGAWSGRLEWAHVSAHYGDGIRDDASRPSNLDAYSREYVRLWGARELGPARVYGSVRALLHSLPVGAPLGASVGAEVEGTWRFAPYAAADLQIAQEDGWAPALGGQVGARWVSGTHRMRLGVAGRTGPEDTGKLRPGDERWLGVTLGYDRVAPDIASAPPAPGP